MIGFKKRVTFTKLFGIALVSFVMPAVATGEEPAHFDDLKIEYVQTVHPLIHKFCLDCHSSEKQEGDFDIENFATFGEVRSDPQAWQKVAVMLDDQQMPPEESPQLSGDQRQRLRGWVGKYLEAEAQAGAGDPGPVVLRRLNNAEYSYTVTDLTGIELDPAREFPVDSAAGEGFTNTGSALVMSPTLVTKYFDAAKDIASHAVLLPEGIRFSQGSTRRDWTNERLNEIRAIYLRHTGHLGDANLLNGWGVADPKKLTDYDGRVELDMYFAALVRHRERLQSSLDAIDSIAREESLNAKYLRHLASMLIISQPKSLLLESIRQQWRQASLKDVPNLTAAIRAWQDNLWKRNTVGHFGSSRPWQEPVSPLVESQNFRIKIEEKQGGDGVVTLFLIAGSAGDGNSSDMVRWINPRFECEGRPTIFLRDVRTESKASEETEGADFGLDSKLFGIHSNGLPVSSEDLVVHAPSVLEVQLPTSLLAGYEFVVSGTLHDAESENGSVQLQVSDDRPLDVDALLPGVPIVLLSGSQAEAQFRQSIVQFRKLFPVAMCYPKIVPVDEVVTLVLFHREDEPLTRLMLEDVEKTRLDQLWDELHYVSQDALISEIAFEQLMEFATQDSDPALFEPLRKPVEERAALFRQRQIDTEPAQLDALLEFAARAFRRPLTDRESVEIPSLYNTLRQQPMPHPEAIRLTLARLLTSPAFLYRLEKPGPEETPDPITDWELATRLSYFLWSSLPDDELRQLAAAGRLSEPETLVSQTHRMLNHAHARRMAIQFACQWLLIRDFDQHDEKNERRFPQFNSLREAMYEESILFFTDLFQNNGSVLSILDADHTFLNESLAKHYGIPGVEGDHWRRVDNVSKYLRGGILAQATTLSKQSGASRTSAILRGNWVAETLLGERLPRPPKDVPQLPQTVPEDLTERQLIEQHRADPACSKCHDRTDPYGFALEKFDAIGRFRERDDGDHPIDTQSTLLDGTTIEGFQGLRDYLLTIRRETIVRHFCRKLLGYALGRAVQLSDEPLLDTMTSQLAEKEYRFNVAVEAIVLSDQFRKIRGNNFAKDHLAKTMKPDENGN